MTTPSIDQLAADAARGDATALDRFVRGIKDDVFGLAIRMLGHPADAEDATQEILTRVVTRLGTFEGRSSVRTWVYRITVRGLLNFRRGRRELSLTFEDFGDDLREGLTDGPPHDMPAAERLVLRREVKIACTQAMLLCLDRDHRMAYLLGEIVGLSSGEAAACLDMEAAAFRKRLSRARQRVNRFTRQACGLVSETADCTCDRRIAPALAQGRIDPRQLLFAQRPRPVSEAETGLVVDAIERFTSHAAVLRSDPRYIAPDGVIAELRAWMATTPRAAPSTAR